MNNKKLYKSLQAKLDQTNKTFQTTIKITHNKKNIAITKILEANGYISKYKINNRYLHLRRKTYQGRNVLTKIRHIPYNTKIAKQERNNHFSPKILTTPLGLALQKAQSSKSKKHIYTIQLK